MNSTLFIIVIIVLIIAGGIFVFFIEFADSNNEEIKKAKVEASKRASSKRDNEYIAASVGQPGMYAGSYSITRVDTKQDSSAPWKKSTPEAEGMSGDYIKVEIDGFFGGVICGYAFCSHFSVGTKTEVHHDGRNGFPATLLDLEPCSIGETSIRAYIVNGHPYLELSTHTNSKWSEANCYYGHALVNGFPSISNSQN